MRILVYLLTLLMVFAPTYSAYAAGITKGQIVQMGKQGGALVKTGAGVAVKVGKVGRALSPFGVILWCAKYKKKCDEIIDETVEIACDISGVCTVEHKQEDEDPVDNCNFVYGYEVSYNSWRAEKPISRLYLPSDGGVYRTLEQAQKPLKQEAKQRDAEIEIRDLDSGSIMSQYELKQRCRTLPVGYATIAGYMSHQSYDFIKDGNRVQNKVIIKMRYLVKYTDDDQKNQSKRLTNDELTALAKKIAEQMDDDDIKNYYNTDYDDITINNYHYYGDDIDNETNIDNQCQNNSCNEISKEIEKDIQNKKYDIDDVTPANCTMEENTGKYIACNMKIDNEEENNMNEDGDTNKKDGDDTDTPKKEDDDPLSCDSSKFHKKICDWMDWTKDDLEVSEEDKPKIKDLAEDLVIKKDRVRFNAQCPSPKEISITVSGQGFSDHLNYQPFCDLMTKSKPFVIGISGISALLIVAGSLRR